MTSTNARPAIGPAMRSISSTAAIRKALRDGREVMALIYDEVTGYRALPVIDVATSRHRGVVVRTENLRWWRVGTWYEAGLSTQTYRAVDVYAGKGRKS